MLIVKVRSKVKVIQRSRWNNHWQKLNHWSDLNQIWHIDSPWPKDGSALHSHDLSDLGWPQKVTIELLVTFKWNFAWRLSWVQGLFCSIWTWPQWPWLTSRGWSRLYGQIRTRFCTTILLGLRNNLNYTSWHWWRSRSLKGQVDTIINGG